MSPDFEALLDQQLAQLPPGVAWPNDRDSLMAALMEPLAHGLADLYAAAETMLREIDPRRAIWLLEEYEEALGPDPCGRDPRTMTLRERQALAHQRWTARGGQSIPYFASLAERLGIPVTVGEVRVSVAGLLEAGGELVPDGEQFVWTVTTDFERVVEFEAGGNVAGDPLFEILITDVECDIRRAKPAHTEVVFAYLESDT